MTDAVDARLEGTIRAAFDTHAALCAPCRREFEEEASVKAIVGSRLGMVRTPGRLMLGIAETLEAEQRLRRPAPLPRRRGSLAPALGFAAAFALAVVLFSNRSEQDGPVLKASFASVELIAQAVRDYKDVASGRSSPGIRSLRPDELLGYFRDSTTFPVTVPPMRDCDLVGGRVARQQTGASLAQVVYRHEDQMVFMVQACWNEVQRGERLDLPSAVRAELLKSGCYSAERDDGCAVVLWTSGGTLCCAVARMPLEELAACVANEGGGRAR
ncbi:MAG: hypothetical protein WB626_03965 [Bacteroidota bacterium]